jgi:CRP/FNR family transcriptional regulator, dissimilatory nitrate respiration regulator
MPAPHLPETLRALLPPHLQNLCALQAAGRGTVLFHQRQKPRWMHYIAGGEAVLQRAGRQGEAVVLQRVRQGFLAEASLQASAYHCDAVVSVDAEIVTVPMAALRDALAADPAFALRWIAMLNAELRRLRAQCERLSLKGVRERLLHLLESEGTGGRLAVPAGLKSVAAELGVSHEALYRTVAKLEQEGVIAREPGVVVRE